MTQYKAHSLIRHVQHDWSFLPANLNEFIDVIPAQQRFDENWYQGTADAVFQNLDILRSNHHLTIACIEVPLAEARAFSVMGVNDEGRIVDFQEKPGQPTPIPSQPGRALASMGIYVFNARFLYDELIRDAQEGTSSHDFGKDLIPCLVSRACVFANRFADSCVNIVGDEPYWRDVGTVDAYWEAQPESHPIRTRTVVPFEIN